MNADERESLNSYWRSFASIRGQSLLRHSSSETRNSPVFNLNHAPGNLCSSCEVYQSMKHKTLKIAIAGVIAFLIGFLSTIRSAPAQNRFDLKVRNDFFAGYAGDKDALARGMKACEAALAADPKNAEAMVWHGSGVLVGAQQLFASGDSEKAVPVWMRGLAEMQAAVDLAPDSVGVRIPRGAVLLTASHYTPDANMAKPLIVEGVSDYQRAYDLQKEYFATLGTHPRGELLLGLADG